MKKLIAVTALLAVAGASAQSTSEIKVKQKKKSFAEKMSYFYWSDMRTGTLNEEVRGNTPDTSMYNMFNIRYTMNDTHRVNVQVRFALNDTNDENGKGDRFAEDDARFTYQGLIYRDKKLTIRGTMGLQFPTSRGSQADEDRILRLKPNMFIGYKIDDFNSLLVVPGYTRTLYTRGQAPTDETSRYYLSSWVMWTNSYLSEKYKLRADLETKHIHQPGAADTSIETTSFNIVGGVDININGLSVFPYVVHDTFGTKSLDTLGGGLQFFKVF